MARFNTLHFNGNQIRVLPREEWEKFYGVVSIGKAFKHEADLRFLVWPEEQPKVTKRVLKMVMV